MWLMFGCILCRGILHIQTVNYLLVRLNSPSDLDMGLFVPSEIFASFYQTEYS